MIIKIVKIIILYMIDGYYLLYDFPHFSFHDDDILGNIREN